MPHGTQFSPLLLLQFDMKLLVKKLLSLHQDGANCYLLIIEQKYKIMLDCGISHSFDFKKYREAAHELKDLKLVLISHSALEYSGAYPFLISELGLNPKIFYTTQPIMRYSPLNLHEELLNLRLDRYNKKIFNKIYSEYEEMNLVKPFQKKELQLNTAQQDKMVEERSQTLRETDKKIHFCCYLAGGYLGSVYWRISYGLINIIYLVDYNNYAMHHISGLDLDNLKSQSTHLLITDACSQRVEDMKKDKLYQSLKQKIVEFFVGSGVDPTKPGGFSPKNDPKMLIPCYPTELTVEILATVRKVVADLQQGTNSIEKIGMIHLSSRYLQLVKSQSEYFQPEFKGMLEKLDEYFRQSLSLDNRITVCPYQSLKGILARPQLKDINICCVLSDDLREGRDKEVMRGNLRGMRIFQEEDEKLAKSAGKLSLSKIQSKGQMKDGTKMEVEEENSMDVEEQAKIQEQFPSNFYEKKHMNSKYLSAISGIPRFVLDKREKDEQMTEFGLRYHYERRVKEEKLTIYDVLKNQGDETFDERMMSKKTSKIEIMNICFQLPDETNTPIAIPPYSILKNVHKTQYHSSLKIFRLLAPANIVLLNVPNPSTFRSYQIDVPKLFSAGPSMQRRINIFDLNAKKNCYLSFQNQLLEYKMNYLPEMQQKKVQKVRGTIVKDGNCLHIRLDCLQNQEIAQFRLDQFYSIMKRKVPDCNFVGGGVQIMGVKVYRRENDIILEGQYSQEYFKVRKELYAFLDIK